MGWGATRIRNHWEPHPRGHKRDERRAHRPESISLKRLSPIASCSLDRLRPAPLQTPAPAVALPPLMLGKTTTERWPAI